MVTSKITMIAGPRVTKRRKMTTLLKVRKAAVKMLIQRKERNSQNQLEVWKILSQQNFSISEKISTQ